MHQKWGMQSMLPCGHEAKHLMLAPPPHDGSYRQVCKHISGRASSSEFDRRQKRQRSQIWCVDLVWWDYSIRIIAFSLKYDLYSSATYICVFCFSVVVVFASVTCALEKNTIKPSRRWHHLQSIDSWYSNQCINWYLKWLQYFWHFFYCRI